MFMNKCIGLSTKQLQNLLFYTSSLFWEIVTIIRSIVPGKKSLVRPPPLLPNQKEMDKKLITNWVHCPTTYLPYVQTSNSAGLILNNLDKLYRIIHCCISTVRNFICLIDFCKIVLRCMNVYSLRSRI